MRLDTENTLSLLSRDFSSNEEVLDVLSTSLKDNYLHMTKAIRQLLELTNDLSTPALTELAEEIGVAEIHVTDEQGVLTYSNAVEVIGFDFNDSDQSRVFLEALKNKQFELAQDPMPRGADGKYIMYTGIARLDKPGVIQLGIEPEQYESLVNSFDFQDIVQTYTFAETGYTFIADKEGEIIAHAERGKVGMNISELFPMDMVQSKQGELFHNGEYMQYVQHESGYTLFASVETNDYFSQLYDLQKNLIFYSVLWLIIITIVTHYLSQRNVTKPVSHVISKLDEVARGNLSVTFETNRKDEIGTIAFHMNEMVTHLKKLMHEISESSLQVAGTSEQLSASGQDISRSSEQISITVQTIATHIDNQFENIQDCTALTEQLSNRMEQMTDVIESISDSANRSSQSSQEGNQLIDETTTQMRRMIDQVEQTEKVVEQLNDKMGQIEKVISIISEITEQTNLLALNASIEAARAGDAGKGFAVVADEVRKLAEETVESTNQIASIISEVKTDSIEAVKMMGMTNDDAKRSEDLVEKAGFAFMHIYESINTVARELQTVTSYIYENKEQSLNIHDKMNALSDISKNIVDSIQTITKAVSEHTHTLEDISSATNDLTKMAESLSMEAEKYKIANETLR